MHLHVWQPSLRGQGNGTHFVQESARLYFERFQLQRLYCEPAAKNPAPNRTLARAGFTFVKMHTYAPAPHNYVQDMNQWLLTREQWDSGTSVRT